MTDVVGCFMSVHFPNITEPQDVNLQSLVPEIGFL